MNTSRTISTAWLVVILLVPVALLNYLDRQMLATMRASMKADIPDLELKANWGLILGSFKWVYAVLSPIGGFIADRFSRRHVIVVSLFVWSAVTLATGFVTTFHELLAARALMGISEAFYIPAALALIADYHNRDTRSRAVGIHQMGIYIGNIIGIGAGYAAEMPGFGWRLVFQIAGIVGMLYAIPLFLFLKNPTRPQDDVRHTSPGDAIQGLSSNFAFWLLVIYFTLPALAGWVVRDWMPDIMRERFDLQQGNAGLFAVLPVQLASICGVLIGGYLADRWMRQTPNGRKYVSALGMLLFLPALVGLGFSTHVAIAIAFLFVYGFGWGFFDCNNMPILSQIVRPELRATGYGIMNFVSISAGGLADWGFGILRDKNVALGTIFTVFGGIALLSVVIVLCIRPNPEYSQDV